MAPRTVLRGLAVLFGVAALFHAAALVAPSLAEPSPAWRHALFVAINLGLAYGLWTRPRWFVPVFAVFTVQQLYSHGGHALEVWTTEGRVDGESVIVLLGVPATLVLLLRARAMPPAR